MIEIYDYNKANMYYSNGTISFEELIAIIRGNVSLEVLEAERMAL